MAGPIAFREYRASEAGRIVGITPELQRAWRRRGVLRYGPWAASTDSGWNSFTLVDVIVGRVFKIAGDLGFPNKAAQYIASHAAGPISQFLLLVDGAIEGELNGTILPLRDERLSEPHDRFLIAEFCEAAQGYFSSDEWDARITICDAAKVAQLIATGKAQAHRILDFKQIANDIFERGGCSPIFTMHLKVQKHPQKVSS